jgi:hypothetical protein
MCRLVFSSNFFIVAAARGEGEGSKHQKNVSPNLHCCDYHYDLVV